MSKLFFFLSIAAVFLGLVAALNTKNARSPSIAHDSPFSLSSIYERHRASGKLSKFADTVYRALLSAGGATATPSKYGSATFYPAGSPSAPCAGPVGEINAFGLNTCYPTYDWETNSTTYSMFKYNSTYGTAKGYSSSNCTGTPLYSHTLAIGSCDSQGDGNVKLMPASSSPKITTKPGLLITAYSSKSNCQGNTGSGVQGGVWLAETNNNCYVYDTVLNMGNSSSFACTAPDAFTYIAYNESSNCYGQGQASTFPASYMNCQQAETVGMAYGWPYYTCAQGVESWPTAKPTKSPSSGLRVGTH